MDELADTRERLERGARRALIAGGLALAAVIAGALADPVQALRAWLVAWFFWLGIGVGGLAIVLLHHLTGGAWGIPIRRPLEAAARTLPLLAVLFVPVVVGAHWIYPWATTGAGHEAERLSPRAIYLNLPFFSARALLYFVVWIALAYGIERRARRLETEPTLAVLRRLRALAAPGLALYAVAMTFAAVDWGMSLEPHWHSTIYGVIHLVGQALAGICFAIVVAGALRERAPFRESLSPRHFHDLGNLTLAFVLLWSYVSFSQYLIIWSANLPREASWYVRRLGGGWQALALALLLLHFAVPFVVLLSRKAKRSARILMAVAGGLLVLRLLDLRWILAPSFDPESHLGWRDLVTPIAIGGLWLGTWARSLARGPLAPPAPAGVATAPVPPPAPPTAQRSVA